MGNLQELGVKTADQNVGALDQCSDFIQQGSVRHDLHTATKAGAGLGDLSFDLGAALRKTRNHCPFAFQSFGVFVGVPELHHVHA